MCVCTTCNGLRFDVVITRSCHQKAPSHMKSSAARAPSSSKWRKHVSQRNPPRTKINGARSPRVPGAQCACQCASDGTQFWNMGPRHSPRPKYTLMDPHPVAVREITTANLAGAWSAQPVPVSDWSHSNGWLSSPLAREDEKGLEDRKVKTAVLCFCVGAQVTLKSKTCVLPLLALVLAASRVHHGHRAGHVLHAARHAQAAAGAPGAQPGDDRVLCPHDLEEPYGHHRER